MKWDRGAKSGAYGPFHLTGPEKDLSFSLGIIRKLAGDSLANPWLFDGMIKLTG
jgi:hypothetical protein